MRKVLSFILTLTFILVLFSVPVFASDAIQVDLVGVFGGFDTGMALSILGILTFFVQVIVEATKRLPLIYKIPTDAWAIIVSFVVCIFTLFGYAAWQGLAVQWYYIGLALFASLVVAYISMYGWTKINALYLRQTKRVE